jgi:hypothetical protein
MADADHLPPTPVLTNYPVGVAIALIAVTTALLVFVGGRLDPTHGVLTISILIILAFMATVAFCLLFNIPTDEITPAAVGGLTAGFGAVVAYWLGRPKN